MNLKEHLQFLIMMIPTLLLLIAAVITLAAPVKTAQRDVDFGLVEIAIVDTEIGPVETVLVR